MDKDLELINAGKCTECKRKYTKSKSEKDELVDNIKNTKTNGREYKVIIKEYIKEQDIHIEDLKNCNTKLNNLDFQTRSWKNDIIRLKSLIQNYEKKIDELTISKQIHSVKMLNKELKEYETTYKKDNVMLSGILMCEGLLSDKGIRAYITNKYLPVLNKSIKKYLSIFELRLTFKLDSEFNQVFDDRFRNCKPYDALSSGEKSRVNLATLFAFMDFAELRSGSRINLLILDEIIDGSGLDTDGKETLLNILKFNVKKKLIYITHDPLFKDFFHTTIKMEKKRFSEMEFK